MEGFALSEGEGFHKIPLKGGFRLFGAIGDQHIGSRVQKRRIRDKMKQIRISGRQFIDPVQNQKKLLAAITAAVICPEGF